MEKKKLWKRLLSVTLSVCMIVGLITVSGTNKAEAADGTNILANGDFASASSAWVDQNGTLVPAQTLVDDINVTSEVKFLNDFSGSSPTWGWNINNTTTSVVEKYGNQVLSFAPGGNKYISTYGFLGWNNQFTVGANYRISCRVYSDTAVSFRLYDNNTGKYDLHTTAVGDWSTYTIDLTATATGTTLYFHYMDSSSGPVYIDDLKIEQITTTTNTETVYTVEASNDFSSGSTRGWNLQGGTGSLYTFDDENQVLSWTGKTTSANTYITYYGSSFTAGETYVISCKVKANGETSVRLYFDGDGSQITKTVNSNAWTEFSITINPTQDITSGANASVFYFAVRDMSGNTAYIDDLVIAKATEATAQTYTEGIGTCKNAETDNVLVMKDYTKVTQPVTITSGETYSYSFAVKGVDTGDDFAASVIAGDEVVQAITATSEWTTVEGQFTATANATDFGFARKGEGELWIDDVVLASSKPTPTDHTSLEGPYIPEGHENLLSGAATDFSGSGHGHTVPSGASVQNGYLKTPMKSDYIQFGGMSTVAGQEYTFSCYIWTEGSGYKLQMYEAGAGSASGSSWEWLTYSCGKDTNGWTKVEYSFIAQGTGTVHIGFQETWGGEVTLYVDDVALTTTKSKPSDHTVQGGAYIPEGLTAVFSQDMSTSNSLNLGSLSGAVVEEGMLKLPFTGQGYVQTSQITVTAGTAYTLSFYAWVDGAANGFKFNAFATGAGNGWKDYIATNITGDTNGWQLVTYEFTATTDDPILFGFMNYGSAAGTIYLDDIALSTEAVGEAEDITLSYGHGSSNFHYEQENRLYIKSTGTKEAKLTGTLKINGTEVSMTYEHHEGSIVLLFNGKLSDADVNTVVIPAGTTLYNGSTAVYNIANTFTIYTQKVADGQWMTWLSEYDYQGSDVMYYDMGTAGAKYVFNNVTGITYQGVLTVTGKADIMLGGTENASHEVTTLGDYKVSRTIKSEKYDYTVALYKRGDADKTQDGTLTAKDLVASKLAVSAVEDTFGHARYKAADSNTDGVVNEEDAAFMRYILVNDYDVTTTTSKGYSTLGQGVMPIVGSGGPDDHNTTTNSDLIKRNKLNAAYNNDFLTDEILGLVADLGFNTFLNHVNEVGNDYETSTRMLKIAEKYNMGVYINNAYISSPDLVDDMENQVVPQTAKYDSFPSFHGYYIEDEPDNTSAISNYTIQLNALKNHANIASYFNMSPLGDSSFNGNTSTYTAYLQAALATGAESLQYDMYLRGKDEFIGGYKIKTSEFYTNLDLARSQSMNASKPFHAWVQTGANWIDTSFDGVDANNKLTIQEMYLEANAALAMGAKGINYFTLLESTTQVDNGDNYTGLITVTGEANHNEGGNYDYYNAAKKINTYIAAVDEVLMNATSKGVVTTNNTVKGYIGEAAINATDEEAGVIKEVTGSQEALVGCFDYYGKDAYLIVNITPDEENKASEQTITLNFDGTYSYTATDMTCTKTTASGQSASFTVGAGEAVLVVVE